MAPNTSQRDHSGRVFKRYPNLGVPGLDRSTLGVGAVGGRQVRGEVLLFHRQLHHHILRTARHDIIRHGGRTGG